MGMVRITIASMRPINVLIAVLAVIAGSTVELGTTIGDEILDLFLLSMAVIAVVGGANIYNDINDINIDTRNHPKRPIASGRIKLNQAKRYFLALWLIGVLLTSLISFLNHNPLPIIIIFFTIFCDILYEKILKSRGLPGNLSIGVLTGAIILFGGSLWSPGPVIFFLALIATLSTTSREIIKDVQDMQGEIGTRNTLPLRIGKRRSLDLSSFFMVLAVVLSWGPIYYIGFDGFYIAFIGLADLIMIYGSFIAIKKIVIGQVIIKAGMLLAVIGFIISSLI